MSIWDLIDLDELQSIQNNFARATNLSSVIMSSTGEPITHFSNPTTFCSLIQSTEKGNRRCIQSFMEMAQKVRQTQQQKMFFCFVNGGHFVSPIVIEGVHHGTMFAGQFLPQPYTQEQLVELEGVADEIGLPPERLVEEGQKMRVVDKDVVENQAMLFSSIVMAITRMGAQILLERRALEEQEHSAELQSANEQLQQQIALVEQQHELISQQRDAILELSTPLIRIWDRTIVLPIIGTLDAQRSREVRRRLMREIRTEKLKNVLIDVTGVDVVDTGTAKQLIKLATGVKLLGAECLLTGITPDVAETLIDIGADLSEMQTRRDVQEGMTEFFRQSRQSSNRRSRRQEAGRAPKGT